MDCSRSAVCWIDVGGDSRRTAGNGDKPRDAVHTHLSRGAQRHRRVRWENEPTNDPRSPPGRRPAGRPAASNCLAFVPSVSEERTGDSLVTDAPSYEPPPAASEAAEPKEVPRDAGAPDSNGLKASGGRAEGPRSTTLDPGGSLEAPPPSESEVPMDSRDELSEPDNMDSGGDPEGDPKSLEDADETAATTAPADEFAGTPPADSSNLASRDEGGDLQGDPPTATEQPEMIEPPSSDLQKTQLPDGEPQPGKATPSAGGSVDLALKDAQRDQGEPPQDTALKDAQRDQGEPPQDTALKDAQRDQGEPPRGEPPRGEPPREGRQSQEDRPQDDKKPPDSSTIRVDGDPGDSKLVSTLEQADTRSAMDKALVDSQPQNYESRHEEGAWIIRNETTGETRVERVPSGERAGISPGEQPNLNANEQVEGFMHTHPNPETDEHGDAWRQGPSDTDKRWADYHQIPVVVRSASDVYVYFPKTSR